MLTLFLGDDFLLLYTLAHYFLKELPNCYDWGNSLFHGQKFTALENRFNNIGHLGSDFRHHGHALSILPLLLNENSREAPGQLISADLVSNTSVTLLLQPQSLRLSQIKPYPIRSPKFFSSKEKISLIDMFTPIPSLFPHHVVKNAQKFPAVLEPISSRQI